MSGLTELARELRAQRTPAENLLWQLLRNRQLQGFKFRRQHQFGGYVADFYCRKACLVVECDGSAHNSNGQWQHDQVRDAYMLSQGLRVLRFSNDQILNDTENVLREIAEYLVPSDEEPSKLKEEDSGSFFLGKPSSPTLLPKGEGRKRGLNSRE